MGLPLALWCLRISKRDSVQVHGLANEYWLGFDTHFLLVLRHQRGYLIMHWTTVDAAQASRWRLARLLSLSLSKLGEVCLLKTTNQTKQMAGPWVYKSKGEGCVRDVGYEVQTRKGSWWRVRALKWESVETQKEEWALTRKSVAAVWAQGGSRSSRHRLVGLWRLLGICILSHWRGSSFPCQVESETTCLPCLFRVEINWEQGGMPV